MVLFGGEVDDVVLSSSWLPVEAWASLAAGAAWSLMFLGGFKILAKAKAKQFLDLTRNNNGENLLDQRHGERHVACSVVMICAGRS